MARILLVDDMTGVRNALTAVLTNRGHQVIQAENGQAGMAAVNSQAVDIVLTDIVMPLKDGSEFIAELKTIRPDIKIIAMSGGTDGMDGGQMLSLAAAQANKLLAKPFDRSVLLEAIEELSPSVAV